MGDGKTRIVVLGGGLGACTAAYWLTSQPGWADRYEVTLYQLGWRLGGKGASARNMKAGYGHRIEEHGLHIWFGFYENAFRTMHALYRDLAAVDPPPVATFKDWTQAFHPQSLVTLEEQVGKDWQHWPLLFPVDGDTPGTGKGVRLWDLLVQLIGWMRDLHDQMAASKGGGGWLERMAREAEQFVEGAADRTLLHAVERLAKALPAEAADQTAAHPHHDVLADLMRRFIDSLHEEIDKVEEDPALRRFRILLDLGGAVVIGVLRDRLLTRGFESADGRDLMEWLRYHGCRPQSAASAPINTVYDLVFGFEAGDTDRPNFAAGTALRGMLRMLFGYRGAVMFKMQAGMGDTIFTPLYGVLRQRGVKFEFFHRVDKLGLAKDGSRLVDRIELTRQVDLKPEVEARGGYRPLVRVGGLDCWPGEPDYDQIVDGDQLRSDPYDPGRPYDLESHWTSWKNAGTLTLERERDFDVVVLAIPVGALGGMCRELADADPRWQAMLDGVKTAATQGVQLWLRPTTDELGWVIPDWAIEAQKQAGRPMGLDAVLGGYAQPLDTWADMTHLLPMESWSGPGAPRSIAYWCGPLADVPGDHPPDEHGFPRAQRDKLAADSWTFVSANAGWLWPKGAPAENPAGLDPGLLVDPEERRGRDRWAAQFFRTNFDPSERYVLSVKGSTALRLRADQSGFGNLYLAGDWIYNGVLNAGCVEATVSSGMEAARAICGAPADIVGDVEGSARS